jgi:hypothetical protein
MSTTPYTTKVISINDEKAFLQAKILPNRGETVSYDAYDSNFLSIFSGPGEISRVVDDHDKKNRGFEIKIDKEAIVPKKPRRKIQ